MAADTREDTTTDEVWPSHRRGAMAARFLPVVALFLASGAALVLAIVLNWSLPVALAFTVGTTFVLGAVTFRRATPAVRQVLARRLWVGFTVGVLATVAYDITRFGVVSLFSLSLEPFHTIEVFGKMFVGDPDAQTAIVAAGLAYHFCNGIAFSIAYVLVFRRPSIPTALAWAALLEAFMITLYPGWLKLNTVDELALVSVLGHIVFGLTLGIASRWMLDDDRRRLAAARSVPVPPRPPTGPELGP